MIVTQPLHAAPHLVLDLESGQVLSHQQAFDPWHPASLTKLMTAYTVFKAIQDGTIIGNQPVRMSKNASRQPPSKMGYPAGTTMTMDDALKLLAIKSANDISVAIAESVSGSVETFAAKMNRDARALGMADTRFVNPHGLHDRRQVTTAHDMALLVRAIHRQFPQYKDLFESPSVLAPSRSKNGKTIQRIYYSYNLLLERYRGADGFKTGFVCASGYNFIGAATRSGRRLAAIVLGRDSQTSRAVDVAKLLTDGFQQPLAAGTAIGELKPNGSIPTGPRNMRSILCTKKARAARYEPGAGQAVIDSPWLEPRDIKRSPLTVTLLAPAQKPPNLRRVPLPSFRPDQVVSTVQQSTAPSNPLPVVVRRIPLPNFRPQS
ncbi:MAG: D-alanyl-D-alanine carboxypeptidase family protein [Rhizobiaceae bacterium]